MPAYQCNSFFVRCDARPDDLDAGNARLRNHEKTDFLIGTWDPGILWTDFGVRADIVVRLEFWFSVSRFSTTFAAVHTWISPGRHP
jgi:hypothetical protein